MRIKNLNIYIMTSVLCIVGASAYSAAPAKKSAIQGGTGVRAKVEATGLYSQECYDAYYGCMDQFCIAENVDGGSCSCSDENASYETKLAKIKEQLTSANQLSTVEVEKIKAGAQADIIFNGERQYDSAGKVINVEGTNDADKKKKDLLALWNDNTASSDEEEVFYENGESIADKKGNALYSAANEMCAAKVTASCSTDLVFLQKMYQTQIKSDCKAFENTVQKKQEEADTVLATAKSDVRSALKESFNAANKYDRGTCMVNFKKCMLTDDACKSDWTNCVGVVAFENMQNQTAVSTAGTKVKTVAKYEITDSTIEILESKRNICENVLDQCVAVRDYIWDDFLREAAPTIKLAELNAESNMRQSCLTNISNCIQKACKDDIVGKGTATMDACLSRPDMARSFCKVQIDPCERMEPLIWGYVTDKLAAMRVDACTSEVKECFTADDRCGEDFSNCIGMDYDYIHDICPLDKLVVCKANNPKFAMEDLDSMLMGLYLNIDNSALENCEKLVDEKMTEICGSTTDCNKFAADDTIGTGSIKSQKDGTIYRVTGMISFGSIKMGDASGTKKDAKNKLGVGEIGIEEYLEKVRENNTNVANAEGIISSIDEELNNIAGTINRTIDIIEQDPKIQYCISGRDVSQITGKDGKTTARFPNLLNQVKMQIAMSALRQAQTNYNKKLNESISKATKDSSADLAQYMCQKMAESGSSSPTNSLNADTPLTPPYAISYDVGAGLNTEDLLKGGSGIMQANGPSFKNTGYLANTKSSSMGGVTKTANAVFNRETRNCHICTTSIIQSCKTTGSSSWFHNSRGMKCDTSAPVEKCEDIPM